MQNIYRNILFHIPHNSEQFPFWIKNQFVLSPSQMRNELILMTDYKTNALFSFDLRQKKLVAKVSRLVVDVERFADDGEEIMSQVGMGVIYEKTLERTDLRRKITGVEREKLLKKYYYAHHKKFYSFVKNIVDDSGKCLVIDCHSFSSFRQKYEITSSAMRPEICLGTDNFHTSQKLLEAAQNAFSARGFEVGINTPFAGRDCAA